MEKVLLFSNSKKVFEVTNTITSGKYKLSWCTYDSLKENQYPHSDIIIMHFDRKMTKDGTFESIIKVKGRLGHAIPILALIEEGDPQDIFSILNAGAYDYLEKTDDMQKYKKKIDELALWNWYLKHSNQKNSSDD
jgi:DNA-binding response OmpR family regulator